MFDRQMVAENLRRHVHHLSVIIGERHIWKNKSLDKAAEYIDSVFRITQLATKHQTFSCYGKTVSNLIVEKQGKKGTLSYSEHIMIPFRDHRVQTIMHPL